MDQYFMKKAAQIGFDEGGDPTQERPVEYHLKAIETAIDTIKNNLRHLPSDERAEAHTKMRDGYQAVDALRGML